MNRSKPTGAALRSLLNVGHIGSDPGPLTPSVPITDMAMHLSIERIDAYDHNPRRQRNPRYEEIKDSIRSQGVKQPLVVTRRPDTERYLLRFGGNTRLAILRELWSETADQRFQTVDCVFRPWTNEADVLVGHLIENETRGDLSFIDKARAILQAGTLIETERNTRLSQRQLADMLRDHGYRIDQSQISRYEYTMSVLAKNIPLALESGIGTPQVRRLRQLDNAAERLWCRHQLGPAEAYREVFGNALASADSHCWDFEHGRSAVETAIANCAGINIRLVTLEMDGEIDQPPVDSENRPAARSEAFESTVNSEQPDSLSGSTRHATDRAPLRTPIWEPTPVAPLQRSMLEATSGSYMAATSSKSDKAVSTVKHGQRSARDGDMPDATRSEPELGRDRKTAIIGSAPLEPFKGSLPDAIRSQWVTLRNQLSRCGDQYSRLAGLEHCVRTDESLQMGLGYLVTDFPDADLCIAAAQNERRRNILAWTWWTLVLCCDLFLANEHIIEQHPDSVDADRVRSELFGAGSRFVSAWRDLPSVTASIRQTVGHADPFGYSDYADAASSELWAADLALRRAYGDIRAFAMATGIDVVNDLHAHSAT